MSPLRWEPVACPGCDRILSGLGRYCEDCGEYTDRMGATTDTTPEQRALPDTRSEDQRKQDARPAVEALGWIVCDMEQGYRPTNCPACQHRLPGGHSTRVRTGFPDWVVMGHKIVVFLEWKSGTGKPTETQRAFAADAAVAGVPYYVVRTTAEALDALNHAHRRAA